MKCDRERLSHYLDGELNQEEVGQLREHLAVCDRCSDDLAAFRRVENSVRHLDRRATPDQLRQALLRKVEQRQHSRVRLGRALLLPAIATALVASAIGVWRLIPSGSAPVLTAAFVVQETPESLDGLRVEFVFDRSIAPDSVVQGVQMDPPLPLIQRVQDNKVELVPQSALPPGDSYRIVVGNVRDQRGNVQSEPVAFNLITGPTATLLQESGGDAVQVSGRSGADTRESQPAAASYSSSSEKGAFGAALTPLAASSWSSPVGRSILTGIAGGPDIQLKVGAQTGPERTIQLGEQAFQGGAMLMRADAGQVYVLVRSSGRWLSFANNWRPGEVLAPAGARPPGTLEPLRGFGKVWRDQPAVKLQLGWPVYEERGAAGGIQLCESGLLIRSSYGVVYALFNDGTWRSLPYSKL